MVIVLQLALHRSARSLPALLPVTLPALRDLCRSACRRQLAASIYQQPALGRRRNDRPHRHRWGGSPREFPVATGYHGAAPAGRCRRARGGGSRRARAGWIPPQPWWATASAQSRQSGIFRPRANPEWAGIQTNRPSRPRKVTAPPRVSTATARRPIPRAESCRTAPASRGSSLTCIAGGLICRGLYTE